ncbi:hypothetical protein STEG23_023596 [Scotinomys teguina]
MSKLRCLLCLTQWRSAEGDNAQESKCHPCRHQWCYLRMTLQADYALGNLAYAYETKRCAMPDPDVLNRQQHSLSPDYWSLGCLISALTAAVPLSNVRDVHVCCSLAGPPLGLSRSCSEDVVD